MKNDIATPKKQTLNYVLLIKIELNYALMNEASFMHPSFREIKIEKNLTLWVRVKLVFAKVLTVFCYKSVFQLLVLLG